MNTQLARPIVFLDLDDVLVVSQVYTRYQVIATFKAGDLDGWPEMRANLVLPEARDNLAALHREFALHYVVSSSWTKYLDRAQIDEVFLRTGLEFIVHSMHPQWTTPKSEHSARLDEIEAWIDAHHQPGQPVLVLDDPTSGGGMVDSTLDLMGYLLLCEPSIGFVTAKLAAAQRALRAQINQIAI